MLTTAAGTFTQIGELVFLSALDTPLTPTSPFASSEFGAGLEVGKAFDGSRSTNWSSTSADMSDGDTHIGATLASDPVAISIRTAPASASSTPTAFSVQKNISGTWTTIWSVSGEPAWALGERRTFVNPGYSIPSGVVLTAGHEAGDSSGTNVQCVWSSEHDGSKYKNNSGAGLTLTSVTIKDVTSAGGTTQLAIYADNGSGAPGALLGVTETKVLGTGTTSFSVTGTITLTAGQVFFIVVRSSGNVNCDGGTGNNQYYKSLAGTSAFTDPFGASSTFSRVIPAFVTGATP